MNENFDKKMTQILSDCHPRILLHACCAPCASAVVERLKPLCDITLYYFNPNIMPKQEYDLRLENLVKLSGIFDVPLIVGDYNNEEYLYRVKGMEDLPEGGARCFKCISYRLAETALKAKEDKYDYFCSTLSISPHKNAQFINAEGERLSNTLGIKWLYNDFKKRQGFLRSTILCKELGIYRQNYCGCRL